MFALTDKAERKYFEVPVIYKGSLLYIVSGLCEQDPRMPTSRFWACSAIGRGRSRTNGYPCRHAPGGSRPCRLVSDGRRRAELAMRGDTAWGFPLDQEREDSSKYLLENGFQPWDA